MTRLCRNSPLRAATLALIMATTASLLNPAAAQAAAGAPFLAHQALYDLSLVKSRGSSSIDSAKGRILYKFSGSPCEGYTSDFRQVSELDSGEGKTTLSDLQSTSWEDADGKSYRFKINTRMDDGTPSAVDGVAERSGDHVTVKLNKPEAKTFNLGGDTVFPTEQIRRIIAAAKAGKSILELTVYDGSDNGEKVYNTMTVIGRSIALEKDGSDSDPSTTNDATKSLARWPVTVSYYDRDVKADSGEQTPVYAMSFELFEDGVSRALVLDYNDFVISGKMDKFDVKDSKPCN